MKLIKSLVIIAIGLIVFSFIASNMAMLEIENSIKEQNEILKEMVVAMQEQVKEAREQNKILNYNPMEEEK